MSHTPSKYQSAIYDWFATGENNAIVSAVAGSGKTTSIVNGMKHLPAGEQRSAFFAAFNKSIVEELKGRLNGSAQCQTMHSLGYGALRQALPSVPKWDIQDYKYREIAKRAKIEASGDRSILQDAIVALHRFAQMSLTPMSNPIKMEEMATLFDVDLPAPLENLIPTIQTLDEEGKRLTELGIISFGDMLYQPIKMAAKFKQYDFVAVDEVQDLSAVQRAVIERTVSRNGRIVGVGDPMQAIYLFSGASPDSFHQVADHFNAQPMPLSICYRCPVNVVNLAKTIVPQIEPWENAQAGIVADIGEDTFQSMLKSGDMILCRLTGPLVKLCFELIAKKIHARIKGRDIGMQLISVVKQVAKIPGFAFDQFLTSLYAHQERQLLKLMAKPGTESQQESLRDRIECLAVCFTSFHSPTLEAFCRDIEGLFADQSAAITLSTIHRAKGLENPRVFIIAPEKLPLVWKGQSPAQAIQELNLKYVAITRAQDALYFVKPELNGQKPIDFPGF